MTQPLRAAVIGLGAIGSMSLWSLAKRGVEVTGYDQFAPSNNRGASSGETRMFRVAYKEGSEYTPLLLESIDLWHELQAATQRPIFTQNGSITIGRPEHETLQRLQENAKEGGIELEVVDREAMAVRYPGYRLLEGEIGLFDRLGGLLRVENSVITAVEEAQRLGATVHTGTRVVGVEEVEGGVAVITEAGSEVYDKVIVAPGPWAMKTLPGLAPLVQPERIVCIWFPTQSPEKFTPDCFFPTIRRGNDLDMSCFPTVDGTFVKVNLHLPRTLVDDVDNRDREVEDAYVEATREAVRTGFNDLSDMAVRRESYVEGYTQDMHPIVGPISPEGNIIALTGFSGHGFKFSPAMGEVAADLAITGTTSRPISQMAPNRVMVSN
jgi:sarcosine oxidase